MFVPLLVCLVCAFAAVAGCDNNPYPPGESGGAVLYRALTDDPKTLDPSVSYTVQEAAIVDLLYPSFYQYHYLKRDPYALELAMGAEEPVRVPHSLPPDDGGPASGAGERWTFRIKPGLRFQDDPCFPGGVGREIVAADFLFSFRRMADPGISSPVLSFISDKIIGLESFTKQNREQLERGEPVDYDLPVAGLQADPQDRYTFHVVLNQPYPQLRYLMAMHFTSPLAREAVEMYGAELARHPVGSGPYVLAEHRPKQRIVLRANPNRRVEYFPHEGATGDREAGLLADAGRQLPLADTVVFNIIREGVTGWNLFLQGYQDSWGVSQDNYHQAIGQGGQVSPAMAERGVGLSEMVGTNIWYFVFNMADPVVGGYTPEKRKLRQAISLAIDSRAFIDLFRQGNGTEAEFLIPPGIFGYDPQYRNPYRRHSVAEAKRLLAEAGYPAGIDKETGDRLTLYYDNNAVDAAGRQFVGLLIKQLQDVGIRVESRSWRTNVFRDRVLQDQFQFVRYSWYADYPDPENFVFLLYSANRHPGPNHAGYDNPQYDRLFERMRALDDGPERMDLIRQMREVAVEDAPWVFLWHDVSLSLKHDWLANVKPHPISYDVAKYQRVDADRRVERQALWNRPNLRPLAGAALLFAALCVPAAATVRRRGRRRIRRQSGGGA